MTYCGMSGTTPGKSGTENRVEIGGDARAVYRCSCGKTVKLSKAGMPTTGVYSTYQIPRHKTPER